MNTLEQSNITIGEIVAHDFRTAAVFKKHNIDFCCRGNRSLKEVCGNKGLDVNAINAELESVTSNNVQKTEDFQEWTLDVLANYIEQTHHRYVEEKSVVILQFLQKLCKVHGGNHPELHEVQDEFFATAQALAAHMKKEELILFPHIRKMVKAKKYDEVLPESHFGNVENPIAMMEHEHDIEGERFRKIAKITQGYTPPADACNTYRVTYMMLQDFEDDLHQHIHLENNILFPKAIKMQKEIS